MKIVTNLDSDNIRGLVFGLAIPSMIAQFVSVLYSIVDRMYIGNIPLIGETALAGVGICGPIVTMIAACSSLIGIGGGPLVSIKLGEGKDKSAEEILSNCFIFLLAISAAVMLISYILKNSMLRWFGASEAVFPYAEQYMSVYLAGTFFALLSTGMNQFIICQGYSKTAMHSVLIGAIANIVLDPIFIFVLKMNVAGAALATVLSQLLSCIFVLRFLFSSHSNLRIHMVTPKLDIFKKVCMVGLTPFLIIAFDNVMLIALNAMITKHGGNNGDMLLTCNTILQSFMLVITMPLEGITGGTQPILGYNYGARRADKIKKAQKEILLMSLIYCTLGFLFAEIAPQLFIRIFTKDPVYIEMTKKIIRLYTIGVPALSIQYMIVDGFTALGLYKYAFPLSAWRKILYFACVFIIPAIANVNSIFFCEPISDIIGAAVSTIVFVIFTKKFLNSIE